MYRLGSIALTCGAVLLFLARSTAEAADPATALPRPAHLGRAPAPPQAALDQVFMVKARSCPSDPASRVLTGFRVRAGGSRPTGIVTALHGVAGCRTISAGNRSGHVILNLKVRRVSIPGDLALLSTDSLDAFPSVGFAVPSASSADFAAMGQPRVAGHPYGQLGVDSRIVQIPQPPMDRISNMVIGPSSRVTDFINRGSPDAARFAVAVIGYVAPGHSGAPLYTGVSAYAVISGGQLNQPAGKSWAIPLANAQWSAGTTPLPASVLQSPSSNSFYFFESDDSELYYPPLPPQDTSVIQPLLPREAQREDEVGRNHFIRTAVSLSPDGKVRAQVSLRNEHALLGFCATSAVAFFDAADNLMGTVAHGSQWCVDGKLLGPLTSGTRRDEVFLGEIDFMVVPRIAKIAIIHQAGKKDVVGNFLREQIRNRAARTQQ